MFTVKVLYHAWFILGMYETREEADTAGRNTARKFKVYETCKSHYAQMAKYPIAKFVKV
jgi:hypothetical protein